MNKFALDYQQLNDKINPDQVYRLDEVAHRIKKVAFDVVRFIDADNIDGLWRIEHTPEGDYIVAMYDEAAPREKTASCDWEVLSDASGKGLTFFYKETPVVRLATSQIGIEEKEAREMSYYLPHKLAANKNLVRGLMQEVELKTRIELFQKFPELRGETK